MKKIAITLTIFTLLVGSIVISGEKKTKANEIDYQGESFEQGLYQNEAPEPYGLNSSQNSQYASTNTDKVNWIIDMSDGKGAEAFRGTPAIDKDGTIYINNQNGNLYAINPDGSEKWALNGFNDYYSVVIGNDGTLYNASRNLYAINPDGTIKWSTATSVPGAKFNEIAIDKDGVIYSFNGTDKKLYAFNPDGSLKSKSTSEIKNSDTFLLYENALTISQSGLVYMLGSSSSKKYLLALDKSGNLVWSHLFSYINIGYAMNQEGNLIVTNGGSGNPQKIYKIDGLTGETIIEKVVSTKSSSILTTPVVDYNDGSVYAFIDSELRKFDNDLNPIWENSDNSGTSQIIIDKNSDIVFVGRGGITKLNKSGEQIWKVEASKLTTPGSSIVLQWLNPAIDKNGVVYATYGSSKGGGLQHNLISIGDVGIQNYCTHFESIKEKMNNNTLTEEEQLNAIKEAQKLLDELNNYSAE